VAAKAVAAMCVELRALQNFAGLFAVLRALDDAPLKRLATFFNDVWTQADKVSFPVFS
jgi:hypothetical protein